MARKSGSNAVGLAQPVGLLSLLHSHNQLAMRVRRKEASGLVSGVVLVLSCALEMTFWTNLEQVKGKQCK